MKAKRILYWSIVIFCLVVAALAVQPVRAAFGMQAGPEPITVPKLTADLLFTLTGSILSILAWVIPPFRRWQQSLGEWTPAFMAGALLALAVGYQFVWCGYSAACLLSNWQGTILIWGTCVATNFAAYKGIVKPEKEKLKAALMIYPHA